MTALSNTTDLLALPRDTLLRCVQLVLCGEVKRMAESDTFVRQAMELCHIRAHPLHGPTTPFDRRTRAFQDVMQALLTSLPAPSPVCVCASCAILYKGQFVQPSPCTPSDRIASVDPHIMSVAEHLCELSWTVGLHNALKRRLPEGPGQSYNPAMEMTMRSVTGFPIGRWQQDKGAAVPAQVNSTHILAYTSKFAKVPLKEVKKVLGVVAASHRARDKQLLDEKRQLLVEGLPSLRCDDVCDLVRGGRAVAGEGASGSVRVGVLKYIGYINWWAWPTKEINAHCTPDAQEPDSHFAPFPPLVALKLVTAPVFDQRRFRMMACEASLLQRLTIDFDAMRARMKSTTAITDRLRERITQTMSVGAFLTSLTSLDGITNPSMLLPFDWGGEGSGCPHGNLVAGIAALPFDGIREEDAASLAEIPDPPAPPPSHDVALPARVAVLERADRELLNGFWAAMRGTQGGVHLQLPSASLHLSARQRTQLCPHRAAFVLEYCDGGTLRTFLESDCGGKPISPRLASALFFPVLLGLDVLHHDFGVLHRDIKPENILLCRDDSGVNARGCLLQQQMWRVKVADYGISKPMGDAKTACGTHRYMAPEVRNAVLLSRLVEHEEHKSSMKGEDFIGSRTMYGKAADVFSLGVVLQYLISGGDSSSLGARWVSPDAPHTMDGAEVGEQEDISPEQLVSMAYGRALAKPLQYDTNGRRLSNPTPPDETRWCLQAFWHVPATLMCKCSGTNMASVCLTCGKLTSVILDLLNSMTSVIPARRPTLQELFLHPFTTQYGTFESTSVAGHALWTRTTFSPNSAAVRNYLGHGEGVTLSSLYPLLTFKPQSLAFLSTRIQLHASRSTRGIRSAVERTLQVPDSVATIFDESSSEEESTESYTSSESSYTSSSVDVLDSTSLVAVRASGGMSGRPSGMRSPSPVVPPAHPIVAKTVLVKKAVSEGKVGASGWSCCAAAPQPQRNRPPIAASKLSQRIKK